MVVGKKFTNSEKNAYQKHQANLIHSSPHPVTLKQFTCSISITYWCVCVFVCVCVSKVHVCLHVRVCVYERGLLSPLYDVQGRTVLGGPCYADVQQHPVHSAHDSPSACRFSQKLSPCYKNQKSWNNKQRQDIAGLDTTPAHMLF